MPGPLLCLYRALSGRPRAGHARPLRGNAFLSFRQLIDRNVNQIPADEILGAGIEGVAEFQPAAVLVEPLLNDVGGHAQTDRAVAGLVYGRDGACPSR